MKKKAFVSLIACLICLALAGGIAYASFSLGIYRNFAELSENEIENIDYRITAEDKNSDTTIFTIHGGGIAGGTSQLATALADRGGFNLYLFEGIKSVDNLNLHLTSTEFDEATAINMVSNSTTSVSFIGTREETSLSTYVGGQNKLLGRLITLHLQAAGFNVQDSPYVPVNIAGVLNSNIVNKNKPLLGTYEMGGVQIAVSRGMRNALLEDEAYLQSYIINIDKALISSWPLVVETLSRKFDVDHTSDTVFVVMIQRFSKNILSNQSDNDIDQILQEVLEHDFDSPEALLDELKESANH